MLSGIIFKNPVLPVIGIGAVICQFCHPIITSVPLVH